MNCSCVFLLDFHNEIDIIKIIVCLHIFLIQLAMAGMAPENVRKETMLSLKRLRTDYIDLYLIHHPVSISVCIIDNLISHGRQIKLRLYICVIFLVLTP